MGRNTAGTYSLPLSDRVPGTTITSTWANTTMTDLGSEITQSLSRSGFGGMLAQLKAIDGTQAAPGLSFSDELGTGIWRSGTNSMRAVANAATLQEWTATGCTIALPTTFTTSVSNSASITATGNGTGAGLVATGGATGNGITATGGGTSGVGVAGTGTGASTGVTGTGGATNGKGVTGQGTGSGDGVAGTGGSSNGVGVRGTGGGNGTGVIATGGPGGGNTTGIIATGGGGGAGGIFANGTAATGGTPRNALEVTNGYIGFVGVTAPTSTTSVANALTPANVPKAWAKITTTGGGSSVATVDAGFNIAGASVDSGSGVIFVDFAQDFANANYSCSLATDQAGDILAVYGGTTTGARLTIQAVTHAGATVNYYSGAARSVYVICFGDQ